MVLKSYAKLNLYLDILGLRRDKYHNIKTIFERIGLCDKIIIRPRRDKKIKVSSDSADVPPDNLNLAFAGAKALQDKFHIQEGLDIKIIKRIPVAAGLGGGSSNAASVLLGLNKLWKLNLKPDELCAYAKNIGSDVAFFIHNCRFAEGCVRGDKIKTLRGFGKLSLWHILVVPKLKVSTPRIYKEWDKLNAQKAGLTRAVYDAKILTLALRRKDLAGARKALFNSLETVTCKLYPEVRHIKERLLQLGLKSVLMSGSGPAVFGILSSRKEGQLLARKLRQENETWRVFVIKTI